MKNLGLPTTKTTTITAPDTILTSYSPSRYAYDIIAEFDPEAQQARIDNIDGQQVTYTAQYFEGK